MIGAFARHPTAANLLMLAFLVLGIAAVPQLKRETFPALPSDEVQITILYPGASAGQVEDALCRSVEDALRGINDLEETTCEAAEGKMTAVASMRDGTTPHTFLEDVKSEVDALDDLPDDAEMPVITLLGRTDFVASVAVAGPMDHRDLRAYALDLRDRMRRWGGIPLVEVRGFSQRQLRIGLSASELRGLGLSIADVAATLQAQSLDLPAGTLETRDGDILLRVDDRRMTAEALGDTVIKGAGAGGEVRLGDIAVIEDLFENVETRVTYNGQPAALLEVTKTRADDSLEVMAAVRAFLAAEAARVPPELTLAVTADISSIVRDRLTMLLTNGGQGLVLVFLVMALFFGLRYSVWVTLGLPVAFMGTLFAMQAMGLSLNMMTMVALLIAVGLMMDDAIVIAENIAHRRVKGDGPMDAAVNGALEVMPGVVSSFLTTILVFGALIFLEGNMGAVLGVIPVVLILTLAVSLVEAFLILPRHLLHSLEAEKTARLGPVRAGFERQFSRLRSGLIRRVVAPAVRWRGLTLGIMGALVIASVSLIAGGILQFQAFPDLEGDVVEARLLLPQGTPLARTEQIVDRLVAGAQTVDAAFRPRQPDGQPLVQAISVRTGTNVDAGESGPHVATVTLDLLSSEVRDAPIDAVIADWRTAVGPLADVVSLRFTQREMGPAGEDLSLRILGEDLDRLGAATQELRNWLAGYAGVHDLRQDLRPGKPELVLRLRPGAAALGLDLRTIADQVRTAVQGLEVDNFHQGAESFEVSVRLRPSDRDSLATLDDFAVITPTGEAIPLHALVTVEEQRGWAKILRVDGLRTSTLIGDVDTRVANAGAVLADTRARFLPGWQARYPDLTLDLEGQAAETAETGASLKRDLLVGLVGVFLLLSFQFRSFSEPVVVMSAIPLGLIGAMLGHLGQGIALSMPSMVGLASLSGVVVNDSILLVEFIKARVTNGASPEDAAVAAAEDRFRPILLTSLTTVAGMVPLLMETSLQAQVMIPLATSLAFGLASATLLCLVMVPSFYVLLADFGLAATPRSLRPPKRRDKRESAAPDAPL